MNGSARERYTRGALLRFAGWFAMANAGLAALLGLRFLTAYEFPADPLGLCYTVLAYVGHYATLGVLAALPALLLALVWPWRVAVAVVAVLCGALLLTLLTVDANVFAEYRYHLTPLIAAIFEPSTWLLIAVIALVALAFQAVLAGTVWRWVQAVPRRGGVVLGFTLLAIWLTGQGIHAWADAVGHRPVTQLTRYLPAYFPIKAKRRLAKMNLVDPEVVEQRRLMGQAAGDDAGQLRYPLEAMRCESPATEQPFNLLMVLIDGLRPDAIHPELMPATAALREEGTEFARHYSGGNSSRAGIFSAFYGLPATYMESFYAVQRRPVLVDRLLEAGYTFGLYSAPGFASPMGLNRTAFAGLPGTGTERRDLDALERNRGVTGDWIEWLDAYDPEAGPFFGFLYYDPPMGEMPDDHDPDLPMDDRFASGPERGAWSKYRRAMAMVDTEVGKVRADLESRGLDTRTLVMLWSDHGYEFAETREGRIGHASAFNPAQLRATLLMDWPGREPGRITRRTSHHDLAPTLLAGLLGCSNPPSDYSVGSDLSDSDRLKGQGWEYFIAGSYNAHAIVQPESILVAHPGGFVERLDADYRPLDGGIGAVDADVLRQALEDMRRFYR